MMCLHHRKRERGREITAVLHEQHIQYTRAHQNRHRTVMLLPLLLLLLQQTAGLGVNKLDSK